MDREYQSIIKYEADHGIHEAWHLSNQPSWAKSKRGREKMARKRAEMAERTENSKAVDRYVHDEITRRGFKIWQLMRSIGKPRMTYYHWRNHHTLARHRKQLDAGIKHLDDHPERYRSTGQDVKATLKRHGLTVTNLCQALLVKRPTYYTWCRHDDFNGHGEQVRDALEHLIKINRKRP